MDHAIMPLAEPAQALQPVGEPIGIAMAPDCTIRSIEAACHTLRRAMRQPPDCGVLSVDCALVEQVDITFVQLLVSAVKTASIHNLHLALHAVPPCVQEAIGRSGVQFDAEPCFLS